MSCTAIIFATLFSTAVLTEDAVDLREVDGGTRMKWLIDGTVVDSKTGKPIEEFIATPGTFSVDDSGRSVVRWRDNLKISMRGGEFKWPRTSGFSEMRFRISANGYRPVVTPAMRRGGPYTRIRVTLTRE
ncbi:MAG: hypothetical protein AAFX06_30160 [Planctomycetota bacterium]